MEFFGRTDKNGGLKVKVMGFDEVSMRDVLGKLSQYGHHPVEMTKDLLARILLHLDSDKKHALLIKQIKAGHPNGLSFLRLLIKDVCEIRGRIWKKTMESSEESS